MSNEVAVTVTGRDRLSSELRKAQENAEGFGGSLKRIGEIAAGVFAANVVSSGLQAFTGYVGDSIKAASDLEQSIGGVEAVFGDSAGKILDWGKGAADAAGLSQNAFNELATPLGAMLKNAGFGMDEVTDKTLDLTQRAADMAATFGGSVPDALGAITAALRGETDPIERYGVSLRAADVSARALADTGKQSVNDLTPMEMQQARLAILFEQTADAEGKFASEADTAAGKAERLQAAQENAAASLGEKLLPIQVKVTEAKLAFVNVLVEKVFPAFGRLVEWVEKNVVPVLSAFAEKVQEVVQKYVVPFLRELGERVSEEFAKFQEYYESDIKPAFENIRALVETVVGAVVAFIEDHWPQIQRVIEPVLDEIQNRVETVMGVIQGVIATVLDVIQGDWQGAWDNLKGIVETIVEGVKETLNNLLTFIAELGKLIFDAAKDLGGKIVDGIVAGIKALGGAIGRAIRDAIPDSISLPGPLPSVPLPHIPGLSAAGGVRSGLTLVGEAGPELVNFGDPSRVFNAQDTRDLLGSGGREIVIHNYTVLDGRVIDERIERFNDYQQTRGYRLAGGRG